MYNLSESSWSCGSPTSRKCTFKKQPYRLTSDISLENINGVLTEDRSGLDNDTSLRNTQNEIISSKNEPIGHSSHDGECALKYQYNPRQSSINEDSKHHVGVSSPSRSRRNHKRTRRKLPEIPANATPVTTPIPLSSLAEELKQADPKWKNLLLVAARKECSFLQQTPSATSDSGFIAPPKPKPNHAVHDQDDADSGIVCSDCDKPTESTKTRNSSSTSCTTSCEFSDSAEFIDDVPQVESSKLIQKLNLSREQENTEMKDLEPLDENASSSLSFNSTSQQHAALFSSNNQFLREDSTCCDEMPPTPPPDVRPKQAETIKPIPISEALSIIELEGLEGTHRGCHRFIPRHPEEIAIEIGDPIYVHKEAEDLWCEGINIRTKEKGIFPSVYATDLSLFEEDGDSSATKTVRFKLRFLGSLEVNYHKGNDLLRQAIHKVVITRRITLKNDDLPPLCSLEVNEFGIRMIDKSKELPPGLQNNHFFALKNVTYCGYHPRNDKYMGFVTKHPLEQRFACHVFLGEVSTQCVAEAVGTAFKNFFQQYMAFTHPTEDIYLE